MLLLCIDIGIINMGVAYVKAHSHDYLECIHAACVDITKFTCTRDCKLSHEAIMVDWIAHFISRYQDEFDNADVVLIERQPPMGHRCAEQLLYQAFRSKAVLVHPRSFHCYCNVSGLSYDDRKTAIVLLARRMFKSSSDDALKVLQTERAHDAADAMLFAWYYVSRPDVQFKLYPPAQKKIITDAEAHFKKFVYRKGNTKLLTDAWRA